MDSNFEVDTHKQHIELLFDALVGLQAKAKSSSSQKKWSGNLCYIITPFGLLEH